MAKPQSLPPSSHQKHQASVVRVLEVCPDGFLVTALSTPAVPWQVRCALPPEVLVSPGDELVVLSCQEGPVAIARVRAAACQSQTLADGTRVHVEQERTRVRVERADGTALFQFDAGVGEGTISVQNETLRVHATAGDLSLSAAGEIRLEANRVSARAHMPGHSAQLTLGPRAAQLSAAKLQLKSDDLSVSARMLQVDGEEVRAQHKRAVLQIERLEVIADVAISKARNVYQSVQELLQHKVGSLRTLVTGTAQLHAHEVAHRAAESYKIRSEKIHLG